MLSYLNETGYNAAKLEVVAPIQCRRYLWPLRLRTVPIQFLGLILMSLGSGRVRFRICKPGRSLTGIYHRMPTTSPL